jgi:hypothetical protein
LKNASRTTIVTSSRRSAWLISSSARQRAQRIFDDRLAKGLVGDHPRPKSRLFDDTHSHASTKCGDRLALIIPART